MLERTYKARDMNEALLQIRRDLGPHAIILSSREIRGEAHDGPALEVKAVGDKTDQRVRASEPLRSPNDARCAAFEKRLLSGSVPMNAARTLTMRVKRALREKRTLFVDAVSTCLTEELTFAPGVRARVLALTGPTGVGKTTTVAKLAAAAALVERKTVALICLDHYRIGASEQLARYADLIGVQMECATDEISLERALGKLHRADLVLVDTAGRSPRDTADIQTLADTLARCGEPVEVTMCVTAAMREAELCATLSRHAVLSPSRLIVTKVDEAIHCGGVVAAYVHSGLPLSHFTTGQRVPEDIEMASPNTLSALLCGEEVQ